MKKGILIITGLGLILSSSCVKQAEAEGAEGTKKTVTTIPDKQKNMCPQKNKVYVYSDNGSGRMAKIDWVSTKTSVAVLDEEGFMIVINGAFATDIVFVCVRTIGHR